MKHSVKLVKDLKSILTWLEYPVRNGIELYTGRPEKLTGLLPRELLGNWLVCIVANYKNKDGDYTISSDPTGGDGIIFNRKTARGYKTEHVMVPVEKRGVSNTETLIIESIEKKKNKGVPYASGQILIIFLEAGGKWFPSKVAKLLKLKEPLLFESVWLFGLDDPIQDEYIYNVVELDSNTFQVWKVVISKKFDSWQVIKI